MMAHQNIFKCTICPLTFTEKPEFQAHVRDHFKPLICDMCNKTLIGDKQYEYHVKHCGKKKIQSKSKSNASVSDTNVQYDGNLRIDESLQSAQSFDEANCELLISIEPAENILKSCTACNICGRLFQNEEAVQRHIKTHSADGKRFICGICGNGFNKKSNLEFHMRIHTNERPFACDQCEKAFAHISGLNCHRRVHSGERPYKCPFCNKCYAHSTDLRRHRRTHGGEERRFACSLCSKQFYENKFLRSHMKSHYHDRDDNTRKLKCNEEATSEVKIEVFNNDEYIDYEYIQSE